jgi:hypothetical protein
MIEQNVLRVNGLAYLRARMKPSGRPHSPDGAEDDGAVCLPFF